MTNQLPPPNGRDDEFDVPSAFTALPVDVSPDWDDLTGRVRRHHRRRIQALAGALGLVAVSGPTIGYVVGNNNVATARKGDQAETVARTGAASGGVSSPAATAASASSKPAFGGPDVAGPPTMTKVFVQDLGQYKVRVYRAEQETFDQPVWENGWAPPKDCFPAGTFSVQISDDNIVAQGGVAIGGSSMFGGGGMMAQPIGIQEQAPARLLIASVEPAVTAAKFGFDGQSIDALVRDGIAVAVMAAPGLDWTATERGMDTFTLDTGSGPKSMLQLQAEARRPECEPPAPTAPDLPKPGKNQPADPAAARAALEQSVSKLIDGDKTEADRQSVMIDRRAADDEFNSPDVAGTATELTKSTRAKVTDLVFVDKDLAVGLVQIDSMLGTTYHQWIEMKLDDGTWKATRGSWCMLKSYSGGGCADFNYEDTPEAKYGPRPTGEPEIATAPARTTLAPNP